MNDIEFIYIGWCKGTGRDGVQHDKVWTAFSVGDKYYAGWGARGKKIRFKKHDGLWELDTVIRSKRKKYDEVDNFKLFTIFPYFKEDVQKYLSFDILTDRVM
jgi:hypothetical protein